MTSKECILIFGMHRSGTSVISRTISELGYEGGERLIGAAFDNESGFYEDYEVVAINDRLLSRLKFNWKNYSDIDKVDFEDLQFADLLSKAKSLIEKKYQSNRIFIKDPRLCITAPFWIPILRDSGFTIKGIFCLRNPEEIRASLHIRNLFSNEKSHWLTWVYWVNAVSNFADIPYTIISYEDLRMNLHIVGSSLAEHLNFDSQIVTNKLSSYYNNSLKHHSSSDRISDGSPVFVLYEDLKALSGTRMGLDSYDQFAELYNDNKEELKSSIAEDRSFVKIVLGDADGKQVISVPWDNLESNFGQTIDVNVRLSDISIRLYVYTGAHGVIEIEALDLLDTNDNVLPQKIESDSQNVLTDLLEVDNKGIWFNIVSLGKTEVNRLRINLNFHSSMSPSFRAFQEANSKDNKLQDLMEVMKSPFDILSEINLYNYQKIRRALRNESFSQVSRNARKYIIRKIKGRTIAQKAPLSSSAQLSSTKVVRSILPDKPHSILYVLPEWPNEERSSGERRTLQICNILSRSANIGLFSFDKIEKSHREFLEQSGYNIYGSVKELKTLSKRSFQTIIISKYFNLYNAGGIVSHFRKAKVIIDSVDVNWLKEEEALSLGLPGFTKRKVAYNKQEELKAYGEADEVWVVTDADKSKLIEADVRTKISVVSNIHDVETSDYNFSNGKNLLFLGGYNYYANRESIKWIVNQVWPVVMDIDPDCTLHIAGSGIDEEIEQLGNCQGVKIVGHIPESSLKDYYSKIRMVLVPLLVGSGIKGKVCEAIAHGVPVATNDVGNEGINLIDSVSAVIDNDVQVLAEKTCSILADSSRLEEMSKKAKEQLKNIVSPRIVEQSLIDSLFPQATLCVITWNGLGLLKDCLESIEEFTCYPNYDVIVYSNGCSDGTQEYLTELSRGNDRIRPILSKDNEVFVRPNNKMIEAAGDNDVVLLNNDIVVTKYWLSELQIAVYADDRIGVAGSKLLYEDGTLQEFGSSMGDDGHGINHGKGDANPFRKEYASMRAVGYVSGCCFYIKRSTINAIGALDDDFHPIYCEDSDYCYTAWEHDIYTVVAGKSVIYHLEGATNGTDTNKGLKKYQVDNYKKFMSKHSKNFRSIEARVKQVNKQVGQFN